MRVAGLDPGTLSLGLCVLEDGEAIVERSFPSAALAADPTPLLEQLAALAPLDLVLGPAGYGLPLVAGRDVDEAALALMVLVRPDEAGGDVGVGGLRTLIRALIDAGLEIVFAPGVLHLPTVPDHRKWNRIDLGTADKVAAAALAIDDQSRHLGVRPDETSFVLVELGGAFAAAVAVSGGAIVDGVGGTSGPIGARARGALDGELAYLLGDRLGKGTLFRGGALDPDGVRDLAAPGAIADLAADPAAADGWTALEESAAKAVLALTVALPHPREILLSGRLTGAPRLVAGLADRLAAVAPVRTLGPRAGARGAALLADGLAGGRHAPIVDALALRAARGTVLDHLRLRDGERIRLG